MDHAVLLRGKEMRMVLTNLSNENWQGRKDSNLRMPGSKPGALTAWRRPCIETFHCIQQWRPIRTSRQPGMEAGRKRGQRRLGGLAICEFDETTTAGTRQARPADACQLREQGLDGRFTTAQHRLERIDEHSP